MKIALVTEKPFLKTVVDDVKNVVENAGHEFLLFERYAGEPELLAAAGQADALIVRSDKITERVIGAGRDLKIIVRAGAGYDNVDLAAASARKIVVMNTPGQNSNAVAELAFGMMVYMARNGFTKGTGSELRGKKLGIQAFGYIGRLVAKLGIGFGMDVYAYDPYAERAHMRNNGAKPVDSVEELYGMCDYVSIHAPVTELTRGMVNYDLLSRMLPNATLVNTARKDLINDADLLRVFNEREGFKYITDIAPSNNDELLRFGKRYFATPNKIGAETAEANANAALAAAKQIIKFFAKGETTFQVNKF